LPATSASAPPPRPITPIAEQGIINRSSDHEIAAVRNELTALSKELAAMRSEFESVTAELRRDLDELNRQLGN
jgi:HAMP domain-containing protein